MKRKRIIALLSVASLAAATVVIPWSIRAGDDDGEEKGPHYTFEGAWVGVNERGVVISNNVAPMGPANRNLSVSADILNFDARFLTPYGYMFPEASPLQRVTPRGEIVRTGPRTFEHSYIAYGVSEAGEIVYIWVGSGKAEILDANTYIDAQTYSLFSAKEQVSPVFGPLPDQDVDGDGLPDDGAAPVYAGSSQIIFKRPALLPH
jgi:hypothetical protein